MRRVWSASIRSRLPPLDDPYPQYARLRAGEPVHWSDKLRSWVLFRHDDGQDFFRDDARLSSDRCSHRARRRARPLASSVDLITDFASIPCRSPSSLAGVSENGEDESPDGEQS